MADPLRGNFKDTFDSVSRSLVSIYGVVPADLVEWPSRGVVLNALRAAGNVAVGQLEKTTKTWKEHHPVFLRQIHFNSAGDAEVKIFPSGDIGDVNIWNYLNSGTDERWAVVSKDWDSKTWPGRLVARKGSGHVVVAGKSRMIAAGFTKPERGIAARKWTQMKWVFNPAVEKLETRLWSSIRDNADQFWANGRSITVPGGGTFENAKEVVVIQSDRG